MEFGKKVSLDEILTKLRRKELSFSHEVSSAETALHLSMEEIFDYLERRYELPADDPLKKRVLDHIAECRQCYKSFSRAHRLMVEIETDSVPETTEESKRKAYRMMLNATHKPVVPPELMYGALIATYILRRLYKHRAGRGGEEAGNRNLLYENEAFRCEISIQEGSLIISIAARTTEPIGKYVSVSIISASKVDYNHDLIQWEQEGLARIVSNMPIAADGRTEIEVAKTSLDFDDREHFHLLERIFEEIKIDLYEGMG